MVTMNLDNLVLNLQARLTAKQEQFAMSGNRAAMPPAILSPDWRQSSPGSDTETDTATCIAGTATALPVKRVKRAERIPSRSGLYVVSSRVRTPQHREFHQCHGHDYQSYVRCEVQPGGSVASPVGTPGKRGEHRS